MLYGVHSVSLPNRDLAADVLQETNLVLCKAAEFVPGTNFTAWSCRVAYYEVRASLTNKGRDRHCFDDVLLSRLAARAEHARMTWTCARKNSADAWGNYRRVIMR